MTGDCLIYYIILKREKHFDAVNIKIHRICILEEQKMKSSCISKINVLFFILVFTNLALSSTPNTLNIPLEIEPLQLVAEDINGDSVKDIVIGAYDLPFEGFSPGPPGYLIVNSISDSTGGLRDRIAGSLDTVGVGILIADVEDSFEQPDYLLGGWFKGVADVNEDGLLDIITDKAVIIRNKNGGWCIGPEHDHADGLSATADFDNDGHMDFIARVYSGINNFRIYYGDGTGNFTKDDIEFPHFLEYPVAGDLNGDRLTDFVLGGLDQLYVYINKGDRKWEDRHMYLLHDYKEGWHGMSNRASLADFTGDGIIDIAVGHYTTDKIKLLKGNGDGTFQDARDIGDMSLVGPTAAADFDKDGISDVVASGCYNVEKDWWPSNFITIIYGDSSDQFDNQVSIPLGSVPQDVATGDFNNDGWEDIAVASWGTNSISILYNDKTGSFGNTFILNNNYQLINESLILAADFDGDGNKDIIFGGEEMIAANQGSGDLQLYLAYGKNDETFEEPELLSGNKNLYEGSVIFGYFNEMLEQRNGINNECSLDIGFITKNQRGFYILLNQGNRKWSELMLAVVKDNMGRMITGDFNEDGFQDIVSNNNVVLFGKGDGTFQINDLGLESVNVLSKAIIIDEAGQSAIDLDNDGHLDIVAIKNNSEPGGWIGWGKGDGSFNFIWDERIRARVTTSWPNAHGSIWLADLHNDGLFDIIEPEQIWLNLGNRSFSNALPFGGEPIDVNGDDIWDLVYPYWRFGLIKVRFGITNFGWSAPEVWVCGGKPEGTSIINGPSDNPTSNILIGMHSGISPCTYSNPWQDVSVSDDCGPRIINFIGPLNPGFTTVPTEFVLTFSKSIDPATVHSDSVYLTSAGPDGLLGSSDDKRISSILSYDESKRQITCVPDHLLAEGPYQFAVSGEGVTVISDLSGNALDGEVYEGFASGDDRPGGNFLSTFYVVDSLPESKFEEVVVHGLYSDDNDQFTFPDLIEFDPKQRASISGTIGWIDPADCYFLGELTSGNVVTVDLDGAGADFKLEGGNISIYRNLPDGWFKLGCEVLTDGFTESHLTFPVRYEGEYVLKVGIKGYERTYTYSIDIAIDSAPNPWEPTSQTIFLDFDGSNTNLWGHVVPFDAGVLDFDSARTNELIDAITSIVQEDFAQFPNIIITPEQPVGLDFSSVSIGSVNFPVDAKVDNCNLNHSDEGLVNSLSFWGMRQYGIDSVTQAMANMVSHQIGHLLGLQHINVTSSYSSFIMNDKTSVTLLMMDQVFYRESSNILVYNTGPKLPSPIPPIIGSLTAQPYTTWRGDLGFILVAHDVVDTDGEIIKVQFYYDDNANSLLNIGIDEYLTEDTTSNIWSWFVESNDYTPGEHIFLARAMDNDGAWSDVVSVTVEINEP